MHLTSNVGLWTYFDAMVSRMNSLDQGFWVPAVVYAKPAIDSGYKYVTQLRQMIKMIDNMQNVEKISFISISFADSTAPTEFYPLTLRHHPGYNLNPISMGFTVTAGAISFNLHMQDRAIFSKWDKE